MPGPLDTDIPSGEGPNAGFSSIRIILGALSRVGGKCRVQSDAHHRGSVPL